jgi:hypothetical protein
MPRSVALALALLLAGCGGDGDDPCAGGAPGMAFVIRLPVEAHPPAELSVTYANAMFERFDQVIPGEPWPDPLEIRVPYGAVAVDGPAEAYFTSRPDAYRFAAASFEADLGRCVTVEMTLMVDLDAGVADAPP